MKMSTPGPPKDHRRLRTAVLIAAACMLLAAAASVATSARGFLQVTGECGLVFPRDHGPHPGYRTEWWYYTGHLADAGQQRFGFQLTFFRHQLAPNAARGQWPEAVSPWRTDTLYLAHAAVTDLSNGRHLQAEKISRPALSMAGAREDDGKWTIHLGAWQAAIDGDRHKLKAGTDRFSFNLSLTPFKPVVLHGDEGYSRKGRSAERASCYYSYTRLLARGTLSIGDREHAVTGTAWMDHEFSTAPLEPGIMGWDWFSLQLSDQSEIMIFLLRQEDGTLNPASSGTHVLPSGATSHLAADQIRLSPADHWTSPHSGARYPVQWNISIPDLGYELKTVANVLDQEMRTPQSTQVTYWEGSVEVTGTRSGRPVGGSGYIELTGYARPFDADL